MAIILRHSHSRLELVSERIGGIPFSNVFPGSIEVSQKNNIGAEISVVMFNFSFRLYFLILLRARALERLQI